MYRRNPREMSLSELEDGLHRISDEMHHDIPLSDTTKQDIAVLEEAARRLGGFDIGLTDSQMREMARRQP